MEKGKRKYLLNIFLLLALVVGVFYFMLRDNINEVAGILSTLGVKEFTALFVVSASIVFVCGLIITIFGRKFNRNYKIEDGITTFLISNMFASITPLAIANYPSELYVLKKQNMNTEESVSVVAMDAMVKQIFIALASLFLSIYFISNPMIATIGNHQFNISTLCIILSAINVVVAFGLMLMVLSKRIHSILSKIIYFFIRVFYIKEKEEEAQYKFEQKVEEIGCALKIIFKNKLLFYKGIVLHFVKSLLLYATPYLIYLLLNKSAVFSMSQFIWWYASLMVVVYAASFIPVPGGSVTVEAFATIVLTAAVNNQGAILSTVILLWRFFSCYGIIAFGSLWMLKPIKKKERDITTTIIKEMYLEKTSEKEIENTIR